MILPIVRTAMTALRRDRASLALTFVLPIAFFSVFATIFGRTHDTIPQVHVIVVDEDHSSASANLVRGLRDEGSLVVTMRPDSKNNDAPLYTEATAEAAVKAGQVPVALIIPQGWGQNPIAFGPADPGHAIVMLNDESDPIAPRVVSGLLQEAAMTAMPASMARQGRASMEKYMGALTPEQSKRWEANMAYLDQLEKQPDAQAADAPPAAGKTADADGTGGGGMIAVQSRGVMGEHRNKNMISFYAAGMGVMFLLFTASGSAGSLLDEQDSGTLDRVLSSRITMTTLLAGKLTYNTMLAFAQLVVMFLWGWAVFHLDFFSHIPGFVVIGLATAFAVAAFGMLLASVCRTRAQLGALSTLLIMIMSSAGGSMFPRSMMPPAMQKAGLFTLNAWAVDGFTKVFWRDLPVSALGPQVGVLLAIGTGLFLIARRLARRWEFS